MRVRITQSDIVCAAITAVSAVLCAVVSAKITRAGKDAQNQAELRNRETRLLLDMMHAATQLSVGTAMAIKNGKCNGEMAAGLAAVKECNEKYNSFMEEVALKHMGR